MEKQALSPLLKGMIDTAKKAGAFIRQERENFQYEKVEVKGLNDLVSYVDKTSEQLIVTDLAALFPEAGFIVEENTLNEKKEYNWIVDPLDGTTNFVHGIACYAVSIALVHHTKVVAGVVYEVSRDECFYAENGCGAWLNGKAIRVSARASLSESLIATGFPIYNFSRLENYLSALTYFMKHTHGLRRIGAAAADLCYLACGRVDAFFEYNLNAWDVAAGGLIVQEAGGTVNDFSGGDNWLFGKEISCTNGALLNEFNSVIQQEFKN
ncbi:MAG: inositol monophosphatase [Bacteroidia bacterium]|nr:inositol monophosphatase [Bacteroidia bacterium]